jgi:hypothetical protein
MSYNDYILSQCHEAWLDPDNVPLDYESDMVECDGCGALMNPYDMDVCCVCREVFCIKHMIDVDDGHVCDEWCLDKYREES